MHGKEIGIRVSLVTFSKQYVSIYYSMREC